MALTRSKVEKCLEELVEKLEGSGVPTLGRNGEELSQETVEYVYQDVKRCTFCGGPSVSMSGAMVMLPRHIAMLVSDTPVRHARLLLYGLCRAHLTQTRKDPEFWESKLDARLQTVLAERMKRAAESN
jgi:hypothetical protein